MDALTICKRCGSNACYEQKVNEEVTTYLCMGCGFTTSTLMTENSAVVKQALESSPELYKDLMYLDEGKLVWFPATITVPNQGMVFVDGKSKTDWKWAAVRAVLLQEGDKKASKDQTHKMDMKNVQHFEERDFMDALEVIGFFNMQ